jgi:predicted phosphodiesterase
MDFELVHGSDLDPGHFCKCQDETIESNDIYNDDEMKGESELNFIIVGHSHKPFVKSVGNTTILNPGSVGQTAKGFKP